MTPDQMQTSYMISVVMGLVGTVEIIVGTIFARADDQRRFTGYLLQYSGAGFFAASLIIYFAPGYYLGLGAGWAAAMIGCSLGALRMVRAMKATSGDASR